MSHSFDDVVRDAITRAVGSGDWIGIKDNDRQEEGSLQHVHFEDATVIYDNCEDPEHLDVSVSGLGVVFYKDSDGHEQEVEQDVTVSAKINISVESVEGGSFKAVATAKIEGAVLDG